MTWTWKKTTTLGRNKANIGRTWKTQNWIRSWNKTNKRLGRKRLGQKQRTSSKKTNDMDLEQNQMTWTWNKTN